jgi:hypothetical protein
MNAVVEDLLRAFEELPDAEKRELASRIVQWEASAEHPPLTDKELVSGAEAVFLSLDRAEEPHG